jgi:uncharacterized cupin superfamily protein
MRGPSFTEAVAELQLEPLPLEPGTIVSGRPEASILVLDESPDGRVSRGVWQLTEGVVTDVEEDELFVVLSGRATVEVEGGPTLELTPGTVCVLRAGDRTTWRVHETLRKVFQTTESA